MKLKLPNIIFRIIINKILNGFICNIIIIAMLIFSTYGIIEIIIYRSLDTPVLTILSNSILPDFLLAYGYSLTIFGVFASIIIYKYRFIGFIIWNLAESLFDGVGITVSKNDNFNDGVVFYAPGGQIEHSIILTVCLILLLNYKIIYSGKRILLILIYVALVNYPILTFTPIIILGQGLINEIIGELIAIISVLLVINFKNLNQFMNTNIRGNLNG